MKLSKWKEKNLKMKNGITKLLPPLDIIDDFFKKLLIPYLAVLFLISIIEPVFVKLFSSLRGNSYLAKLDFSSLYLENWNGGRIITLLVLLASLLIFSIINLWQKFNRKYTLSNSRIVIYLSFTVYYLFAWRLSINYVLKPYFDIFFIFIGLLLIIHCYSFLWLQKKRTENSGIGFYSDTPIENPEEDELNRKNYAKEIAKKILYSNNKSSLAIGIVGEWGSGKTSFLNLLKSNLDTKENIIVSFNPWNSSSPENLTDDFFNSLGGELKKYDSKMSLLLNTYVKSLSQTEPTLKIPFFNLKPRNWVGKKTIEEKFRLINKLIKRHGKKCIIFIDDLDRLGNREIMEVLKLVRNTANFHNTVFVVAYDRSYVDSAISKSNSFNHTKFLEKIFQVEFTLPEFRVEKLIKYLEKKLANFPSEQSISSKIAKTISSSFFHKSYYRQKDISAFGEIIKTHRDINRLINTFSLSYERLSGEVDVEDLLKITAIRIKFPDIYQHFSSNLNKYIKPSSSAEKFGLIGFSEPTFTNVPPEEASEQNRTELGNYLDKIGISINSNILESCFVDLFHRRKKLREDLSISNPNHIYKYLTLRLDEGDLSEIEFSKAWEKQFDDFKEHIIGWCDEGKGDHVRSKLLRFQLSLLSSKSDFDKVIRSLIFLGNSRDNNGKFRLAYKILGYLESTLINENDFIEKEFFEGDKKLFEAYLSNLFAIKSETTQYVESSFLGNINRNFSQVSHIAKSIEFYNLENIKELPIKYLENFLRIEFRKNNESLESNFWDFLHNTKVSSQSSDPNKEEYPQKAKDLVKLLFKKDKTIWFINAVVTNNYASELDDHFVLSDFILQIWDSFIEFYEDASKLEETAEIIEFNTFLSLLKKNQFKPTKFHFKKLYPHRKRG